jgi:hypothetical protein
VNRAYIENRPVTLTLRKVGNRVPKVGEYFDVMSYPSGDEYTPVITKLEGENTSIPYDIYEPVKEETIAA